MDDYRKELSAVPPHEQVNYALFEDLQPPLPEPILPSDPQSLRTAAPYTFPPRNHPSLRALKLSWASSTASNRILFSTQTFFPSVLGQELWQTWLKTRGETPQPGQTSPQAEANSVGFLWRFVLSAAPLFVLLLDTDLKHRSGSGRWTTRFLEARLGDCRSRERLSAAPCRGTMSREPLHPVTSTKLADTVWIDTAPPQQLRHLPLDPGLRTLSRWGNDCASEH